jgi:hypothetical protein
MAMANTLAYYDTAIITTVKSFIAQTPEKVVKRATPGKKNFIIKFCLYQDNVLLPKMLLNC